MPKFKDITGEKFGKLTVIKFSHMKIRSYWTCKCECGNICTISIADLKYGNTKSCGCAKNVRSQKLIGSKYSRLTLLYKDKSKRRNWICKCDCGTIKSIDLSSIKNGTVKSCGCLRKSINNFFIRRGHRKGISKESIIGKIFGSLTVVSFVHKEDAKHTYCSCKCECGNVIVTRASNLLSKNTSSCGCLRESSISKQAKDYFIKMHDAVTEYKIVKNPRTGRYLPYDIYVPKYKVYVEINGAQHYQFSNHFHKSQSIYLYRKELDNIKINFARENGTYIDVDLRKIKTVEDAIKYIEERM